MTAIIGPAVDRLSRKYPRLCCHVVAGDTAQLYAEVTARNIEFAVCRMIGRLPEELAAEVLFHDAVAVMTSAKNPLTRRRRLTMAELADEPWTLFPYDSLFGSVIADIFRRNGHEPPRLTLSSLSVNAQNDLLATGRFITVLPSFVLRVLGRTLPLKAPAGAAAQSADADRVDHPEEPDADTADAAVHRQCSHARADIGEALRQASHPLAPTQATPPTRVSD
jgi:DNA-binding transcriptional LysR family regulator